MLENKRAEQVLPGKGGKVAQIRYTHVRKCKNVKNKKKLIKNIFVRFFCSTL
jgi:hypothetical protein